jgi:putative transposase
MKIIKAFRYRLDANNHQMALFAQFAGSCRFIYNHSLALMMKAYQEHKKTLSYSDLCKELTILKKADQTSWLADVHSQALQQSLKDLESAFKHFFRRIKNKEVPGFPKFKKKGLKDSFRYPQGVKVKDGMVFLPKIGWVTYYDSRLIEGTIAQTTIKKEGIHWFVTIVCEIEIEDPLKKPIVLEKAIGIDLGISHFATLSDGTTIKNPRYLKNALLRLKHAQRQLSRKQKGSNNRKKQIIKVAKYHIKIKNSRKDFLHKESTRIVKNHDVIAVESLNIGGMVKNHKLSQSITDASWNTFLSQLEYKAHWHGKHFVKIAPFSPSTKMCSSCKSQQPMPLNVRTYNCVTCGFVMDRDLNASINIRAAGLAVLNACGGISNG